MSGTKVSVKVMPENKVYEGEIEISQGFNGAPGRNTFVTKMALYYGNEIIEVNPAMSVKTLIRNFEKQYAREWEWLNDGIHTISIK